MRKENSDFKTAFVSEAGSFLDNRDYFAFVELDDMACYVIADGLDTDRELLSAEMAVKVILENFMEKPSLSRKKIKNDLETAHEWLKFESQRVRLKASLLVVVTNYTNMVWASCGNARLYQFRHGRLNLKSKDQSLAQLLVDSGKLAESRLSTHEERGNLLNYLGKPDRFDPYISPKTPLADGDVLLLCTAGMWDQIEIPEIQDALADSSEPEVLTDTLEELLLSKQAQTVNNYTAAAVYVNKIFNEKPKNRKKWIKRIAIMLISMLLMGGGAWYMYAKQAERLVQAAQQMKESIEYGDGYAAAGDYPKALKAYSEAKNAASKLKDKYHFQLLQKKQRVAQTVTDGDGYLKDGSYDMARDSYTKALKEAENLKPYKAEDIQKKIDQSQAIEQIAAMIKQGDGLLQAQDYYGALKTYQKARSAAIEIAYENGQKQADEKIETAQGKIDSLTTQTKTLQADNLEKKGDRSMATMDYSAAIDAYTLAQETYQEINKLERVLAMERKISKVNDLLHPAVPSGGEAEALPGSLDTDTPETSASRPAAPQTASRPAAPAAAPQTATSPAAPTTATPASSKASESGKTSASGASSSAEAPNAASSSPATPASGADKTHAEGGTTP
ncbi:serine/threonine protein phosphatase [Paenibacillus sp. CAA11]|uniref:serine/threonine protein phosphatase n=1 Tax=Paenibacillus sp. CAA11 TaxID=1532905 RepID=UPI0019024EBA|nr:serine/threonine protein phosphatase [Paenibacillus sp. CAA11]